MSSNDLRFAGSETHVAIPLTVHEFEAVARYLDLPVFPPLGLLTKRSLIPALSHLGKLGSGHPSGDIRAEKGGRG